MFNPEWQLNNNISQFRHPLDRKPTEPKVDQKSVNSSKSPKSAQETQDIKTSEPQLSMIWVEESDGDKKRLVVRWVIEE